MGFKLNAQIKLNYIFKLFDKYKHKLYNLKFYLNKFLFFELKELGIGDWGLGIGD